MLKNIFLILTLILVCAIAVSGCQQVGGIIAPKAMFKSEAELRAANKALWETRATLLRKYIVSAMNDSKDTDGAKDRLIKNARDLGASIGPYYGFFAKVMLTDLLKKDVFLTGGVIKAAKIGNKKDLDLIKKKWYANARSVAGFFAIPHNQTKKDLTDMFYKHLDLTWGEIEAMLKKEKAKDLEYYEKDKAHMLMVSDVLVNGLVKQFPKKFNKP